MAKSIYINNNDVAHKVGTILNPKHNNPLRPWNYEIWTVKNGDGTILYNKGKTVENCLVKYGLAKFLPGKGKIQIGYVINSGKPNENVAGMTMPSDIIDFDEKLREGKLSLGYFSHTWNAEPKSKYPQWVIDKFKNFLDSGAIWKTLGSNTNTYDYLISSTNWGDGHFQRYWNDGAMVDFGDEIKFSFKTIDNDKINIVSTFSGLKTKKFIFNFLDNINEQNNKAYISTIHNLSNTFSGSQVDSWEFMDNGKPMDLNLYRTYHPNPQYNFEKRPTVRQWVGIIPRYTYRAFYNFRGESPWFLNWLNHKNANYDFVHAQLKDGFLRGYNKQDFEETPENTWVINHGRWADGQDGTIRWGEGVTDGSNFNSSWLLSSNIKKVGVIIDFHKISNNSIGDVFFGWQGIEEIRLKNLANLDYNFTDLSKWGNLKPLSKASIDYMFNNLVNIRGKYVQGAEWRTFVLRPEQRLTCLPEWKDKITYQMLVDASRKGWDVWIEGISYKDIHLADLGSIDLNQKVSEVKYKVFTITLKESTSENTVTENTLNTKYLIKPADTTELQLSEILGDNYAFNGFIEGATLPEGASKPYTKVIPNDKGIILGVTESAINITLNYSSTILNITHELIN